MDILLKGDAPLKPLPQSRQLDLVFGALSDTTRRAILARLAEGRASVKQLVELFELTQPAVSKHVKVLERAGLVSRSRDGQLRPCRLEAAPLRTAAGWIGGYQRFWEASLDNLDAYVKGLQRRRGRTRKKTHANEP
jgi:DNA-binding transcriptional ArsR family regulator